MSRDASTAPRDQSADRKRMLAGKLATLSILGLAIVMGLVAVVYHHQQQRRALRYWGSEAAQLILTAPVADFIELSAQPPPAQDDADHLDVNRQRRQVTARHPLADAPGFSHLRRSLLHDASFAWDQPVEVEAREWRYALRFRDVAGEVLLLFTEDFTATMRSEHAPPVSTQPAAEALRTYFEPFLLRGDEGAAEQRDQGATE